MQAKHHIANYVVKIEERMKLPTVLSDPETTSQGYLKWTLICLHENSCGLLPSQPAQSKSSFALILIKIIITVLPGGLYGGLLSDSSLNFSCFVLSIFSVCENYGVGTPIF